MGEWLLLGLLLLYGVINPSNGSTALLSYTEEHFRAMPPPLPEWTSNKPSEPGVYQYRPPHAGVIVFYQVEQEPNGQLVAMIQGSLEQWDLADMPGQWRGPILDLSPWQ